MTLERHSRAGWIPGKTPPGPEAAMPSTNNPYFYQPSLGANFLGMVQRPSRVPTLVRCIHGRGIPQPRAVELGERHCGKADWGTHPPSNGPPQFFIPPSLGASFLKMAA